MNIEDIKPGYMVTFTTGSASARVVKVDKNTGVVEIELTKDHVHPDTGVLFPHGFRSNFPALELKPLH